MQTLTIDQLQTIVPAAFADQPAKRTSYRYAFIPTNELIPQITSRGWLPVRARQSSRVADKAHALHSITFRQPSTEVKVGGVVPEVMLINSHDASKRFRLLAGFFRLVCSNGLVVGTGIGETQHSRIHIDNANINLDQVLDRALTTLETSISTIDRWQSVELNFGQRQQFAKDAVLIRNAGNVCWSNHFDAHNFLNHRRQADSGHDLWTTFNIVQENMLRGGVMGVSRLTKPITQVRERLRINEELWQLAETYGNLHGKN